MGPILVGATIRFCLVCRAKRESVDARMRGIGERAAGGGRDGFNW